MLNEAKRAKIPVILTDRAVDSKDPTFYKTFLGSDFIREGQYAGKWVANQYKGATKQVNIVELQGTTGSSPAIDRAKGFRQMIKGNKNLKIIASQTGEFTRAKGKEVMAAFLKANPKIDLLFAHNDDMGLGAIEAIEEAGLKPGKDIKIVTIDAVHDGMVALSQGKINFIAECSPLLGPQLMDLVKKVEGRPGDPAGGSSPSRRPSRPPRRRRRSRAASTETRKTRRYRGLPPSFSPGSVAGHPDTMSTPVLQMRAIDKSVR